MTKPVKDRSFSEALKARLIDRFGEPIVHGYSNFFADFTDGAMTADEVAAVLLNDATLYADFLFDQSGRSQTVEMPMSVKEGRLPNRHILVQQFGDAIRRRGGSDALIKFWRVR